MNRELVGAVLLLVSTLLLLSAAPWVEGEPVSVVLLIGACVFAGAGLAVLWSGRGRS